jgi:hypothetical protein
VHPDFGESRQRRIIGSLIGFLLSVTIFINSGSVVEFIGFTIASVLIAVLTTEICYSIWRRIGRDNIYLKFFASIVGLIVVVLTLYLTVFFAWGTIAGNLYGCMMDMQKPVENKFTGQCRMVGVCGTTPWYYKEGCSSDKWGEASNRCINTIESICNAGRNEFKIPSTCKGDIPNEYDLDNQTITCPN